MFEFVTKPKMVVEGIQRLGLRGAVTHGVRHASTAAGVALLGPFQIRINPTDSICNHACPMCYLQYLPPEDLRAEKIRERKQWMLLNDYKQLLDGMPPGLTEVNIVGGGEPLAHPDVVGIMEEVRSRDLRGYLMTNGTLMKPKVSQRMIDIGWNRTRCSVHAGDAPTFQAIHGVNKFEILKENMLTFQKMRVEAGKEKSCMFSIVNVMQRENIHNIEAMFDFAEEVGVDYVEFELIVPLSIDKLLTIEELKHIKSTMEALAPRYTFASNMERFLEKILKEGEIGRNDEFYRPAKACSVGYDSAFIMGNGDVLPCCFSDEVMGSVKTDTFHDIWYGDKYRKFRSRLMDGKFAKYCSTNRCKYETFLHN